MHTFDTPTPVNLKVELAQGRVEVRAQRTESTTVELTPSRGDEAALELISNAKVEQRGDDIIVLLPRAKSGLFRARAEVEAVITVPLGSSAKLQTSSADIETYGLLGNVKADSGSGEVTLEHVADGALRTGSGDIDVQTATGSLDIKCGSADVTVGTVGGDADIISGSGDVVIGQVAGALKAKSGSGDMVIKSGGERVEALIGSGDLMISRVDHGLVRAKTGSGDIAIGVADGTAAYLDVMTVTGDVKSDLDGTDAPPSGDTHVEISAQSGSGDVLLQRA